MNSEQHRQVVSDFYISLAAVESDEALFAVEKMEEVADRFPAEPAAWANLGVYAMRQGNFALATERIQQALFLAEDNADLVFLAGMVESRKGNVESALRYYREAVQLNPQDPLKLYTLLEELERQDAQQHSERIRELINLVQELEPDNLAVLLEQVRLSAKYAHQESLQEYLQLLEENSVRWPSSAQEEFQEQKKAILEKKGENIGYEMAFLRNSLNQLPRFRNDYERIRIRDEQMGFLFHKFLWLPNMEERAAPPDHKLTFTGEPGQSGAIRMHQAVALADEQEISRLVLSGDQVITGDNRRLPFPNGDSSEPPLPGSVVTADFNHDFLNDLVLAGPGGVRLHRQNKDSTFQDVTAASGLPASVTGDQYTGAWTVDIELDGDLDILLAPKKGGMVALRNNGDGSFKALSYFEDLPNVREMLWGDFDMDGDADIVLLTKEGEVHYYQNQRSGTFEPGEVFTFQEPVFDIHFADLDSDGHFEVLIWRSGGMYALQYDEAEVDWNVRQVLELDDESAPAETSARIHIADLDNNGALDILLADRNRTRYWLSDETLAFEPSGSELPAHIHDLADLNGDHRLDLLGIDKQQKPITYFNKGSEEYHGRVVRPRASGVLGDRRINSFGLGGEIESRSGTQYTKQPVTDPWVHIGLGIYKEAEMIRIIWPNGTTQTEFAELGYDSRILNEQILKGSCPWIYTYNGGEMEFVTDFLWKTSLGLKINDQGTSSVLHSIDWVTIDSDQLQPRNGYYDVRITADLWESHFFDHVSLMAVDHPKETQMFIDERFVLPAPKQQIQMMDRLKPVAAATDYRGKDITERIRHRDGEYSSKPPLTAYQGVAEEYFIEIDLGEASTGEGNQWLIASGWVYPTDTSINVAINQGEQPRPTPVKVKVPDGKGGWKVARENIGFPSGKDKTMLIDLQGLFEEHTPHKIRLVTSMELYWDQFQVGSGTTEVPVDTMELMAESAQLRYRGFSKMIDTERFKPTKGNYQQLSSTSPKWFNLEGYYTRYGEVDELVDRSDDRYVIMNAGDELLLRFPQLDPPREGWQRSFILIGDGWVKDGDFNTGHSKTLLPLPYHGLKDYTEAPESLREDPVFKEHWEDWLRYHTRYVEARRMNTALKN